MNYSIYFVFISLFVFTKSKDIVPKNATEEHIFQLLKKWRSGELDSLTIPFPPLDVIKTPGLSGEYNSNSLKMTYATSDLQFLGVNDFSVLQINVTEEDLTISGLLEFPCINITADNYNLIGRAYLVYQLKGSGRFSANIRNMRLLFRIFFGTRKGKKDLQLKYTIEKLEVNLENSSWPINKILNRDGIKIMDEYHDRIVNGTTDYLLYYLSDYFPTLSPQQIFTLITNFDL